MRKSALRIQPGEIIEQRLEIRKQTSSLETVQERNDFSLREMLLR